MSVQNALFMEKVRRFLFEADKIPAKQRGEFVDRLRADKVFAGGQVGQAALLAIDKSDDLGKASIHGAVFAAYVQSRIDVLDLNAQQTALGQLQVSRPCLGSFLLIRLPVPITDRPRGTP
ncbi:MAG: hypothetical protein A2341_17360 [Deltaproteobacteria bacterium RIFOXYB12_FULL_58_9]|nr:MAG: hypothetical protein A2341_17360 [Deltaproteobacteria bacterium RIFOXYB12_FULL_58_9]